MNDSITLIPGKSFLEPMEVTTKRKITEQKQQQPDKRQKQMNHEGSFDVRVVQLIDDFNLNERGHGPIRMPDRFRMRGNGTIWCDFCGGPHVPGDHKFNDDGEPIYSAFNFKTANLYFDIEGGRFD